MSSVKRRVEEVNAEEGYEEPVDEGDSVHSICSVEALEEDKGSYDGCCREGDVVDWVDDISREGIQRLIEIGHLNDDAPHASDRENISTPMSELVISRKCQFEGNPESFGGHDGYRAN